MQHPITLDVFAYPSVSVPHAHPHTDEHIQHTHTNAEFHCILTPAVRCSHVVVVFLPYTASGFLVRVASSKAEFLKASASSQEECDAREADLAQQVVDLHVVRKRDLDGQWVQNRRLIMQRLHGSWKERDDAQDKLQENLAQEVRRLLRGSPDRVAEAVVLGEFTNPIQGARRWAEIQQRSSRRHRRGEL